MKRILFSLPYGISFRNIVCCGVVDGCMVQGAAPTLLIPNLSAADAARIASSVPAGATVLELKPARHSIRFNALKLAKQHLYAKRAGLDSFRIRHNRRRRASPLLHMGATVLERAAEIMSSEEWLDGQIARAPQPFDAHYRSLLSELRIDVVVLSKPGYQPEDISLIKAARFHRIPTVSVDTTWDNIVAKRPAYLAPDAMTAWSQRMRDEAIEFYRLDPSRVPVTGGAPFDVFFRPASLSSRTEFLQSLKLEPARKLIVFTLNSPLFNLQNPQYVKFLLDSVRNGAIQCVPNVVIRQHPFDRNSDHSEIVKSYERVHLERPFGVPDAESAYECIPNRAEVLHYGALMTHADVVINIGSTTSLDAIAAATPVVNISFDVIDTPPEFSAARFYDYSHYKPILESGAVSLAEDRESFFSIVNDYLADRSIHRELRAAACRQFLTFSDGDSARRISDTITSLA